MALQWWHTCLTDHHEAVWRLVFGYLQKTSSADLTGSALKAALAPSHDRRIWRHWRVVVWEHIWQWSVVPWIRSEKASCANRSPNLSIISVIYPNVFLNHPRWLPGRLMLSWNFDISFTFHLLCRHGHSFVDKVGYLSILYKVKLAKRFQGFFSSIGCEVSA